MLRDTAPPTPKLACFVLYLKIITIFLKMIYAFYSKLSKELKNGIEILVGQAVFKYGSNIQNVVWVNNSWTAWPT